MYKVNKLILTAAVLTLGMMSSAITLANTANSESHAQAATQTQPQQKAGSFTDNVVGNVGEREETNGLNLGSSDVNYRVDTNTGADVVKNFSKNDTVQSQTGQKSEVISSTRTQTKGEAGQYPSFSNEEIISIHMESEPGEEELAVEDEQSKKTELEYREDVAVLYQHLPEDPIYTYGVDGSGKGQCTGTECAEFAAIWDEFEARQADGKSLIILEEDDARKGKIAMPESFAKDVKNQPAIAPTAQDCPTGYTYSDNGNQYQNSAHCGKMDGNTYYVADPQ